MNDNENRVGLIRISYALLAELLVLPANAKVVEVITDTWRNGEFLVKVRCPDFPITEIGNTIPNINPRYRTEQIPETHIPATKNIIFEGWGL